RFGPASLGSVAQPALVAVQIRARVFVSSSNGQHAHRHCHNQTAEKHATRYHLSSVVARHHDEPRLRTTAEALAILMTLHARRWRSASWWLASHALSHRRRQIGYCPRRASHRGSP